MTITVRPIGIVGDLWKAGRFLVWRNMNTYDCSCHWQEVAYGEPRYRCEHIVAVMMVDQPEAFLQKWETYSDYLASDVWKVKRAAAIERDGGACRNCNGTERLVVHHRSYAPRWGLEKPDDLTTLCEACHGAFHATNGTRPVKDRAGTRFVTSRTPARHADPPFTFRPDSHGRIHEAIAEAREWTARKLKGVTTMIRPRRRS